MIRAVDLQEGMVVEAVPVDPFAPGLVRIVGEIVGIVRRAAGGASVSVDIQWFDPLST